MKVLFCASYHDYGQADRGPSFEEVNMHDALRQMDGLEVISFHFDVIQNRGGDVNAEFLATIEREQPDITLIVLFEHYFAPEVLDRAREMTTLVSWGCDDHWHFQDGYMQKYTPHFDYSITTYPPSIRYYEAVGQRNVIVSQWGCNQHFFYPSSKGYLYDVSFVGQCYGPRKEIVNHLWKRGIEVKLFGRKWPQTRGVWGRGRWFAYFGRPWLRDPRKQGLASWLKDWWRTLTGKAWGKVEYAETERLREIYGCSKINLCLNNNITRKDNIKGRNFEAPACRGFLISGPAEGLEEFFEVGKEVVVYGDLDDLSDKILYYLSHDEERERIAHAGYERAMRDHTYEKRFQEIFTHIGVCGR